MKDLIAAIKSLLENGKLAFYNDGVRECLKLVEEYQHKFHNEFKPQTYEEFNGKKEIK